MADNVFEALISAVDRATGPIQRIVSAMRSAATEEKHLNSAGVAAARLHAEALLAERTPVSAVAAAMRAASAGELAYHGRGAAEAAKHAEALAASARPIGAVTTAIAAAEAGEHKFHREGKAEAIEHARGFDRIGEHVKLLREHVGGLRESFGRLGEGMADLLPMFAGLGAVGSAAGLLELSHAAFESASELENAAKAAGITAENLAALRLQAETVHVGADTLSTAMERLGYTVGQVGAGKNKDAIALFRHLGIAVRDAHGHARDAASILPQLADAFSRTASIPMQQLMARTLFGRSGIDLLPLLDQGAAGMKKWAEESAKIDFVPKGEQKEQLEQYEDAWVTLTHAVKGFKDEVGADLAPELTKMLRQFKDWIEANKDWLATKITDQVHDLATAIKAFDWSAAIADFRAAAAPVKALADALGPVPTAIGAITLAFGAPFVAAITTAIRDMKDLTVWAGRAAVAVGTTLVDAFRAAGQAMDTFDRRFTASRVGQVVNILSMVASGLTPHPEQLNAQQRALVQQWHLAPGTTLTAQQAAQLRALATQQPTAWQSLRDQFDTLFGATPNKPAPRLPAGPVPSLIGPRTQTAAPAAPAPEGKVRVQVDISGAPLGTKVQTTTSGNVIAPETNVGYINPLAFGY